MKINLEEIENIIYGESPTLLFLKNEMNILKWIHPKDIYGIDKELAIRTNRILYYGYENSLNIDTNRDRRGYDKNGNAVYHNDEIAIAYMNEVISQREYLKQLPVYYEVELIKVSQHLEGMLYMCLTYETPISDTIFNQKLLTEDEAEICFIMFKNAINHIQMKHIKEELEFQIYEFFKREYSYISYQDDFPGLARYMSKKENLDKIDRILLRSTLYASMPGI